MINGKLYQTISLFKTEAIGNLYHFCYPIFKLYKEKNLSIDM